MNSPFFTSGLAMWSPAPITNNRSLISTITTTVAPTPPTFTNDDESYSFHHKPVYDPPACLVCGLPHPPQDTSSYLLRDQSTITPPEEPSLLTSYHTIPNNNSNNQSVVFIQRPSPQRSWIKSCIYQIRHFWKRFVHHKRPIYPSKRRYH